MNKHRYTDYYGLTETFDQLYAKSKEGKSFSKLMDIIASKSNIKLAFRMIKSNTGSNTKGTDGLTIKEIKDTEINEYVNLVKQRLEYFKPQPVRRVFIPKPNGDKRPLGIPTITDRLVQQAVKQVLEPICEAKFHKHSYGFRPNRSTKHALARVAFLINRARLYYAIDIDIRGFFDNVNHNKLIKQMYSLGIKDRKLLKIIKEMLKAPVKGEGIPKKGTPQGGVLSPLLANIVLNELDWWISSQWETHPYRTDFKHSQDRIRALKRTNLKEMYIVRYADDFKILCRTYNQANKIFIAVSKWLKERLSLEVNKEKSQIINLRKKHSEFLGLKLKAIRKRNRHVARTWVNDKQKEIIGEKIRNKINLIVKETSPENVHKLNSFIFGVHNYYNCATVCSGDFNEIYFKLRKFIDNRLKPIARKTRDRTSHSTLIGIYGECKAQLWVIGRVPIYPIYFVRYKNIINFSQDICDYTINGRLKSSKTLKSQTDWRITQLATSHIRGKSTQYNDNRISRASMCQMKCEITKTDLTINTLHCHHKIPIHLGGNDEFNNLIILHKDIHRLIHATEKETIDRYIRQLCLKENEIKKVNELRSLCRLDKIEMVVS